ncbi:exodeoxyribonuclease VII small subunit [Bacillus sp. RG28]|uniref:Exodeoxyribonuclease 7 small subunit n=1 Tax=Gottfriedia endophytica TaxID=2820819 RepID=A0A940NHZ6_9BACI|nr:exodeoxyribonuclease VII small subunit [Gottfriedia endophytica]MBP0724407.1 exodeoxyribonuclease VII small subunit [Gottfriedia endophytica]
MEEQTLSFEEAIKQIEEIVQKLEQGDVPLEKAIAYFQEGVMLSQICKEKLNTVEKQMATILNEQGEQRPFVIEGE